MVTINVRHVGLTRDELSLLLWQGINRAAARSDSWAQGIATALRLGKESDLSRIPVAEIRDYVTEALAAGGRRAAESENSEWDRDLKDWCGWQVDRAYRMN